MGMVIDGTSGATFPDATTQATAAATKASILATPIAVTGDATAGSEIRLPEDTDNGSNYVALKAPDSIAANTTLSLPTAQTTASLGYLNIPQSGAAKTGSYSLTTTDVGQLIEVGTGGSITIPDATFSTGDAIVIFNNTTGNITITCSITTAYVAGTNTDVASATLATRGICNVLFISGTVCVLTGNV